jgi:hypothetical protein
MSLIWIPPQMTSTDIGSREDLGNFDALHHSGRDCCHRSSGATLATASSLRQRLFHACLSRASHVGTDATRDLKLDRAEQLR